MNLSLMMEREADLRMHAAVQGGRLLVIGQAKMREQEKHAELNAQTAIKEGDHEGSVLAWRERTLSAFHLVSLDPLLERARREEEETRSLFLERRQSRSQLESILDRLETEERIVTERREQRDADDLYLLRRNSGRLSDC